MCNHNMVILWVGVDVVSEIIWSQSSHSLETIWNKEDVPLHTTEGNVT